jgi:adenosylmethionine-8-amino-7-oxononanoate aminotransferase
VTFAKGLTSAYLPLGATVASEQVFDAFQGRRRQYKIRAGKHLRRPSQFLCSGPGKS